MIPSLLTCIHTPRPLAGTRLLDRCLRRLPLALAGAVVAGTLANAQTLEAQTRILFVGNSFTFGEYSESKYYMSASITDENGTGYGGVPAIFKEFSIEAGLNFDVHEETAPGRSFGYHLANKSAIIGRANAWDVVVLQGLSTEPTIQAASPTPSDTTGNRPTFIANAQALEQLVHGGNPAAQVYLYETWARANLTYPTGTPYFGESIFIMGEELHDGYYAAYANDLANFAGVVPCGDAWQRAWNDGLAVVDPYTGYNPATIINLWGYDYYHASDRGYYLNALMLFSKITGVDPRTLGATEIAASSIGISATDAVTLQNLAATQLARTPFTYSEVPLGNVANSTYYLSFPDNSTPFGEYSYLADNRYIFFYGWNTYEFLSDANDGQDGIFAYDFGTNNNPDASIGEFYTSSKVWPYVYSYKLNNWLYYFTGTNSPRQFAEFNTTGGPVQYVSY